MYEIRYSRASIKNLKNLARAEQRRIIQKIEKLSLKPRPQGVEKLSNKDNLYRIRSEDYRIIYEIKDEQLLVLVVKIGHRAEVYKRL